MSKLSDKIVGVVLIAGCAIFCKMCTDMHLKGGDNKAISNYEKMIFDNSIIEAELYPNYKEVTVKIMKLPIKTYEFRYHFDINNQKYEGSHTFNAELPKSNILKVYYLKDDPNFNCYDPKANLEIEKEENSSNKNLYWAIGWGAFGLLMLMGFIISLREEKTQKLLEESNG
ncbi:hypothetical protein [Pedobacter punctiformis]|uniref:DUF3592 domain-containing protein n=1 Tax=Pedobacter punctiformis TaxID=3004097 RepID=A0ABT4LCW2_9SPHI|nr:hypothetical protein [Pedobacter sp. HCMS5-2]MCZ4245760.1 hypothetical protein [Pedobacter sp. HCMS5-2]